MSTAPGRAAGRIAPPAKIVYRGVSFGYAALNPTRS